MTRLEAVVSPPRPPSSGRVLARQYYLARSTGCSLPWVDLQAYPCPYGRSVAQAPREFQNTLVHLGVVTLTVDAQLISNHLHIVATGPMIPHRGV